MKKKIYLLLLLSSLLLVSCSKKTEIKGHISGVAGSKLVLENFNAGKPLVLEETQLDTKGDFHFKVPALDTTEIYNLVLDSSQIIRLVVKPEEQIKITATKKNFGTSYTVSGSEESQLVLEAEQKLWSTRQSLHKLKTKYTTAVTDVEQQRIAKAYQEALAAHHEYLRHFVFDNASSLAAYLALYQKVDAQNYVFGNLNDDKYVRAVAQKMKKEHPNSPYFALLMKELELRSMQKRNAQVLKMVQQAKNSYPELTLNNAAGKEIALSSLKAKYALLYFGILNDAAKSALLPIYNKYHSKGLQIYFVDENPNKDIWQQAVKDLNTPWINVHDTNRLAATIYNIKEVPANYLIEIQGTMEGKDLFGRYLKEKLEKLL